MLGWYVLIGVLQAITLDLCGIKAYGQSYWMILIMTGICCQIAVYAEERKKP